MAAGGRLDGIDLSAKMIDEARKRAIYTDFIVDDFESALAGLDRIYDLAIGADALIYSGDLGPTLAGVVRSLKPGGLFLFTLEKLDERRLGADSRQPLPPRRSLHPRGGRARRVRAARYRRVRAETANRESPSPASRWRA